MKLYPSTLYSKFNLAKNVNNWFWFPIVEISSSFGYMTSTSMSAALLMA